MPNTNKAPRADTAKDKGQRMASLAPKPRQMALPTRTKPHAFAVNRAATGSTAR